MKMEFVVVVHVRERSSNENLFAEKVEMKYYLRPILLELF
jgi:hypothetical protein